MYGCVRAESNILFRARFFGYRKIALVYVILFFLGPDWVQASLAKLIVNGEVSIKDELVLP